MAPSFLSTISKEEGEKTKFSTKREFLRKSLHCSIVLWAVLRWERLVKGHALPLWKPSHFSCCPRSPRMKPSGSAPQQIVSLWSFTVIKRWFSNYSEKPQHFRDVLLDHSMYGDASFVFLPQPLHLVSDLSNKWHIKWLVTMFTLPSSPPPSHSKVSQHDKISIPKPSPRTAKLWFSLFSHKSQIDTGKFLFFVCSVIEKYVFI